MLWIRSIALITVLAAPAWAGPPAYDRLFPPGGRRGTTVAVKAEGTFASWPLKPWISGKGIEIVPRAGKGELSFKIADDAAPGLRWVRLIGVEGAGPLRPFVVGTLPELGEVEPNDGPKAWQAVDGPAAVINGRLSKNDDVDGYAVDLKRGQTLVAAVEANGRLGSPMDGVLQVVSPAGFVLAQVDDAPDRDPKIVFKAPADGRYVVRLFAFPAIPGQRIGFEGGPGFVYRLTLTTAGYVDHASPSAVARGSAAEVDIIGWNLPDEARRLAAPADGPDDLTELFHAALGNTTSVRIPPAGFAVVLEVEPNDLKHPQRLTPPAVVGGHVDPARDVDTYEVVLKQGEKLAIRVESRSLGRPLDGGLRVTDGKGTVLAESDDVGGRRETSPDARDPRLDFTAPADGPYRIAVRDVYAHGGPGHAYLLTVGPPRPEVRLTLKDDTLAIGPGKPKVVTVAVQRLAEFSEAVEVSFEGLPATVTCAAVVSDPKGPTAKSVDLTLKSEGADTWSGPIRVVGKTKSGAFTTATVDLAGYEDARTSDLWLNQLRVAPPDPPAAPAAK
ncbi:PPC domain-containing protein [Isosphaeraceae bacterium EP7]